ncbi:MAG: nuclear transport factor 2 family protein [Pseudomonadota bacterium]
MTELPPELREVIDRQKIYDVLTRYCRALDRCDVELMKTVYWEDGFDDHGVFEGNAQEFAEFIVREIQRWFEVTMHSISNVHMELDGDVAHTESYLIAYHRVKGDAQKLADVFGSTYLRRFADGDRIPHDFVFGGRYVDRLEKRGGVWRIAKRTVVMDWNLNQPTSSLWDEGMFAVLKTYGTRDRSDPVYARDAAPVRR